MERQRTRTTSPDVEATRLFNRHLSWLAFNRRVLSLTDSEHLPLLERLRFLSIWSTNLDEFFQVRVAGLKDDLDEGGLISPDGLTTADQLLAIREEVADQYALIARRYKAIRKELEAEGIVIAKWGRLTGKQQTQLSREFAVRVFPVLTPLAVDPGRPFPYISSLSLSIAVLVQNPLTREERFARIKVPIDLLGRYMQTNDRSALVPIEQVIGANLDQLFPGMTIREWAAFRITRDADLNVEEREAEDLLTAVETQLDRRRFGDVVRLELFHRTSPEIRALLIEELGLAETDVYQVKGLIDLGTGAGFEVTDRPDLFLDRWEPVTPKELTSDAGPADLFALMRRGDIVVHHPYTGFDASVLELIRQSAADPAVQAIKITLYRTAGDGRIVESLVRAAEAGKQVVVIVELKARFDEENNIEWARRLEHAGVHVTYGLVGLKVHAKTMLIVRAESDGLRRYAHIGTGNYNARTAKYYTDLGLLTAERAITNDLSMLFNALTGFGLPPEYERLLVAPHEMRRRIVDLIRREAEHGSKGRIVAKMNSLTDVDMVDELYRASQAGVQIDLIVRGMCVLVPGVEGMSETIQVRSILGRYLEHSRFYFFAHGTDGQLGAGRSATDSGDGRGQAADDASVSPAPEGADREAEAAPAVPLLLIGSADLMRRNLDRRVEVLVPILDPGVAGYICEVMDANLQADRLAWSLGSDGDWTPLADVGRMDLQQALSDQATGRGG